MPTSPWSFVGAVPLRHPPINMASKPKKPYGQMIQPALPNLLFRTGAKGNRTKSVTQQEVEATSGSSTAQAVGSHKPREVEDDIATEPAQSSTSSSTLDNASAHEKTSPSTGWWGFLDCMSLS